MVEAAEEAADAARRAGRARHGLGRPRGPARPRACSPTRAAHDLVVTAEDGIAEGGVGAASLAALGPDGDGDQRAAGPSPSARRSRSCRTASPPTCSPTSASTAPASRPPSLKALDAALSVRSREPRIATGP